MPANTLSDSELWMAFKAGDESAFNMLLDRYWVQLYKLAFQYFHDPEKCKDVVHDVFLNIWQRKQEIELRSVPGYLLTATRYHIYNQLRAAKLSLTYVADYTELDQLTQSAPAEEKIRLQELDKDIDSILNKLPKRCVEIFKMSRFEQLSNQEIADRLSISKRTVENQLALAVKHLKTSLRLVGVLLLFLRIFIKF